MTMIHRKVANFVIALENPHYRCLGIKAQSTNSTSHRHRHTAMDGPSPNQSHADVDVDDMSLAEGKQTQDRG